MKKQYVIIPIAVLAVLAAFSVPAMACGEVVTVKTGTVTDGKVIMQEGPAGNSWTFTVPGGDVQFVRVHWHCNLQGGTPCSATFTNSQGVVHHITIPWNTQNETCGHWECGMQTSHNYWTVNATPGSNTLSGITNCDCMFKFVDIVVDNTIEPATHDGHWWLNQGLMKPSTYNTWFYGAINTGADHTLWTAQSHHECMKIYFNDVKVDDYTASDWFDVRQNTVSNIDTDQSQKVRWVNTDGPYPEFFPWAAMLAEEATVQYPDLVISDIGFQPETPRPSQNFVVKATVHNQGNAGTGTQFDVHLDVNGGSSYSYTVTGVGPLLADASTTVSFTNVNLGEDCHNFTVITDYNGAVTESDENNNAKIEYYQVGNVIAVRSNSDFVDLVNEGYAIVDGGTYYIEDLTITNCGGCGITIENTTDPFVISDCTVMDCGYNGGSLIDHYNGISIENATGGKVTDCIVESNSHRGVSVIKSTYVDVFNNTISDHTERPTSSHGIEVGDVQFPDETKFINIANNTCNNNVYGIELLGFNCTVMGNTIQNNIIYGLYVYGDYSSVFINNITNSGSYGLKVYNSSGNHICGNAFINNNGGGVQGWDNSVNSNYWNTTNPIGYCYPPGTCYTNRTGNYWSDYPSGNDPDGDGIGNTPYSIYGGTMVDYYPMALSARQPISVVMCGDVMCDCVEPEYCDVDGGDVIRLSQWIAGNPVPINYWASNVKCDSEISGGDRIRLAQHVNGYPVPCSCCPPWSGFPSGCSCPGGSWPGCSCPGFEALLAIAAMALIVPCLVRKRKSKRKS